MNSLDKKRKLGQYFTTKDFWLKDHIKKFIYSSNTKNIIDPFAGGGDLLNLFIRDGFKTVGLDIDKRLGWKFNDSLVNIPKFKNSVIITNPPYLTNYSAKRKGLYKSVEKYFLNSKYNDLYQIAIKNSMDSSDFGVMIVPETFINSRFNKSRLVSITVIEEQVFDDTENPICVICFDNKHKKDSEINVYKNNTLIGTLELINNLRKKPNKEKVIKFNSLDGQIALRAVDTTDPKKPIAFMKPSEIDYNLNSIKESSRLITLIEVDVKKDRINNIIKYSNDILKDLREKTSDIILSPFKGNKKDGQRRRRLDYATARAIIEDAYILTSSENTLFK